MGKICAKAVRSLGADIIRKFTESVAEVIGAFLSPTHTKRGLTAYLAGLGLSLSPSFSYNCCQIY